MIYEALLDVLRVMAQNRARAFLTLLGIVIGSGSIVLLSTLLHGGEAALLYANQDALDTDLVTVRRDMPSIADRKRTRRALSRSDAALLADSGALDGAAVGSASSQRAQATYGRRKKRVSMISVTPEAPALYWLRITKGRFLNQDDLEQRRRVCVVGEEVWTELLASGTSWNDMRITVNGQSWTVVGALERKPILGGTDSTDIWDRRVLVPETTYDAVLGSAHEIDHIYVRRRRGPEITMPLEALRKVVYATLLRRHLGVRDFKLEQAQGQGQEDLVIDVSRLLLLGTGLIALFVGGINIMNVMLVTVTERTREIGIRRALGATQQRILRQFLLESALLALLGGAIGVAGGASVAWLAARGLEALLGRWAFALQTWSIELGLGLSVLTGVVFGIYPAWRAANLDPIEALRYE